MEIISSIHRIEIPFEDIYTTVFVIETPSGAVLFDTATFPQDMDDYVFPVLERLGAELKCVFVSHAHRDHAGGLARVLEKFPGVPVAARSGALAEKYANVFAPEDGERILGVLETVGIPGHTRDSMGLMDTRTGTLLTGDSLQAYGIFGSGSWAANISLPRGHLEAINRLRKMKIETLIASHDYHPCGFIARGAQVGGYLDQCEGALRFIRRLINENPQLDDDAIAQKFTQSGLPKLGARIVGAVRREL